MGRICKTSPLLATLIAISLGFGTSFGADSGDNETSNKDRLVVHEWGTFTELQDAQGASLPRINTDDEPVPYFVHGFGDQILKPVVSVTPSFSKRILFDYPDLTVRLETPVIYFYPPADEKGPLLVDVKVGLKNGWLSEYYPNAESFAPGFESQRITKGESGTLEWLGLQVGTDGVFPETDEAVWLKPRATRSATVTTQSGESEKYLFYRGVGEFSGPIRTSIDRQQNELTVNSTISPENGNVEVPAWLVEVRADRSVAFRVIKKVPTHELDQPVSFNYHFQDADFKKAPLNELKASMHAELVAHGLFSDEASAMLSTWNRAYFQSPGLRLFYIVPKPWVWEQMPLSVSGPVAYQRVMVGRIELISDQQREWIEQIKTLPTENSDWMKQISNSEMGRLLRSDSRFDGYGVKIPNAFQHYMQMGRFRNAMLHAELAKRPSDQLVQFMAQYRMAPTKNSGNVATGPIEKAKSDE